MFHKVISFCLILLFAISNAYSAEYSRYLKNYSVEEGLSQSYVNQTIQDDYGYLWVATDYGLNRFDGYEFEQISGPDNIFANDGIIAIKKLKNGKLIVSTYYTGAYFLDPLTLDVTRFYDGKLIETKDEYLSVEEVIEIDDNLWLAIGRHLVLYDTSTNQMKIQFSLAEVPDLIRALYLKDEYIYLGTSKGLYVYHIETGGAGLTHHKPSELPDTDDNNNVKYLAWDHRLGLLVGTVEGLYAIKPHEADSKPRMLIPELNIWGVVRNANAFYIATEKGLYRFDPINLDLNLLAQFSKRHPLVSNNAIKDIYQDDSGLLWLASESKGVYYWHPDLQKFSSFSKASGIDLSNSSVIDFIEIEPGILWISTENGLTKLNIKTKETKHFFVDSNPKNKFGNHFITNVFDAGDGKVWLVHSEGLTLFDTVKEVVVPTNLSAELNKEFSELYAYGTYPIDNGRFIFVSYKGHYILDTVNNSLKSLPNLDKHFDTELSIGFKKSFVDDTGVLYTVGGEIYHYNYQEDTYQLIHQLENYQVHDYKFASDWVRDADGIVWIAYNAHGILALDDKFQVHKEITFADGLPDNRVFSITQSDNNSLWISSQSGLMKYDKSLDTINQYTHEQGLISDEVYNAPHKLKDGRIAFTSPAGIILFNANDIEKVGKEKPVKLLDVEVKSRNSKTTIASILKDDFSLEYDDFGLKFHFSNFDFANQKQIKYRVELDGPSHVKYDNYTKNNIEFTRLTPGKYTFKVAAYSLKTGLAGKTENFNFVVKYNPWTSPLAIICYLLVLIISFISVYVRRVKQQHILQKLHDDSMAAKERARLALEASNSGVWVYNSQDHNIYQERITSDLGYGKELDGSLHDHMTLIHPEDRKRLDTEWRNFSQGNSTLWDVTYRMLSKSGDWIWYRDMGKLSKESNTDGSPVYTGTYTNISETKNKEMQARLYGEALRKMNEWLIILDSKFQLVASNEAFNKRFSKKGEDANQETLLALFNETKQAEYREQLAKLKVGQHLRREEVWVFDNEHIDVLLSISTIGEEYISNYVVVVTDLTQQKIAEKKLKQMANFDHLTQLANRSLINDRIEQAILHAKNKVVAVLFIDLDRFKQVNDSLGHSIGDRLLVKVAERMSRVVGEEHSVGRQSGDEFIILFEDVVSPEEVSQYASDLNKQLEKPYNIDGNTINISSSIGISFYPFDAETTEELIQKADIAMIHAKNSGRNCYRFYTEQLNKDARNRVLLENELVNAVKQNQLTNFYQPIINTQSQKMVGVELLLRWFNKEEMISPGVFIPLAEQIGQIVTITELALEKATRELKDWLANDRNRYLSINLSALHIGQPNLVKSFVDILNSTAVSPRQIRLEITEGILIDDTSNALEQLQRLKDAGFKLYLDDFGTGYSSLTYINQFPIDVIKIDQSFIRQMLSSKTNQAIVQTIAVLAKNLGTYCIAEGVEELTQVTVLKRLGCYNLQGFYFAKPVPASTFLSEEFQSNVERKISACKNA
ncbi:EAL domain-containing protein [Pseudoalteromonas sp. SSM20]|uniref:EAL domain-containing protein n=1 Tax=Pseudoalteromonas sp. SSM20 TaxID=3139394 RepID=UPI003BAD3515